MTIALATQGAQAAFLGDVSAAVSTFTLDVCTYNAHLFGRTGMLGERETGLVFHDELRADQITCNLRELQPDVVGLTEVWDEELGQGIADNLADVYPYSVSSPQAQGIQDVVDHLRVQWPRLACKVLSRVEDVVTFFAQSHYRVGKRSPLIDGALQLVSEDFRVWALKGLLGLPQVWGAGLLFLSKYPLSEEAFFPHPVAADLERFAAKGTLRVNLNLPEERQVTALLTHAQQGYSKKAVTARQQQIMQIEQLAAASEPPVIAMGDFNVTAESVLSEQGVWSSTPEYQWMMQRLSLEDVYRELHPNALEKPGFTYDHRNPLAKKFGVEGAPGERDERIDYVFLGGLRALASRVLKGEFMSDCGDYPLSDHYPLLTQVAI